MRESGLFTESPSRKWTEAVVQNQQTEVSRRSLNLFSVTEVAARIGADLETVTDWVEVGAIDRAVFGGGRFSKNELLRAALVFELVKFGVSPSCARDIVREMEYDLQQIWGGIPRHFKAYAIVIPTNKKWLVSWCWIRPAKEIDPFPAEDEIILPVSDILDRVTDETKQERQH
jgi:uncharacterized small protein (DUF1192 family)